MAKQRPIDFRALRERTTPADVLRLLGISYTMTGDVVRARCPFHAEVSRRPRCWHANHQVWVCERDRLTGDALALYARISGLRTLDAAYALCEALRLDIPYLESR